MNKEATLNDLHRLVSKLVEEGHGGAAVGMNGEYTCWLNINGEVKYELVVGRDGRSWFDLG
jgi:hypothetical protein